MNNRKMQAVAVYCASNDGNDPLLQHMARRTGRLLAQAEVTIIYGGANCGLMGEMTNAALSYGGKVIGVMPRYRAWKEVIHTNLTELIMVEGMHERKLEMSRRADAALILPGALGTLDELFEFATWSQIGIHQPQYRKPVGLLNVDYYYDGLIQQLDEAYYKGLLAATNRELIVDDPSPLSLIKLLNHLCGIPAESCI